MQDPFKLARPAIVSFSGGRTSGYMLRRVLDAFGGALPDDVVAVFCNTGKERPETLDFVERVSQRWGVPITWLEYVATPSGKLRKRDGKPLWTHTFKVVSYETASRDGEPFDMAIRTRGILPNPVMRYCTGELKIKTTNRFVRHGLKWEAYFNAIGFRSDEPDRVYNLRQHERKKPAPAPHLFAEMDEEQEEDRPESWKTVPGETPLCPLFDAGVDREQVDAFWKSQPFDLELKPHEGNCDGCFLKGVQKLLTTFTDRPDLADWWAEWETRIVKEGRARQPETERFRADRPLYRELQMLATGKTLPGHFDFGPPDLSADGKSCALWDDCRCTD